MDVEKKVMEDLLSECGESKNEPIEIARIDINLMQEKHALVIEEHSCCCLCGSHLDFTHITNFFTHEVVEEAHCPSCNIRNRKEVHGLQ